MAMSRVLSVPRLARASLTSLVQKERKEKTGSLRALASASGTIWSARQDILTFLKTGDATTAHALRNRFGLVHGLSMAVVLKDDLLSHAAKPEPAPPATVIVPVFKALSDTRNLLATLRETLPPTQHILLVDDGSKDVELAECLADFSQQNAGARLITHPENMGFVQAVNTALGYVPRNHHVVLLNTDTQPPPDWLPRLLAPIALDGTVASVTPMSNAAEILSVPAATHHSRLSNHQVALIDRTAQKLSHRVVEIPTGIGFCMAINRRFLDKLGGFDPNFGAGYGEEVDWCQRATSLGGRHIALPGLFVGHKGAASFGASRRKQRVRQATRKISKRHPSFTENAIAWQHQDPIAPERLVLALSWLGNVSKTPVRLYIAHAMGGGAESALQQEIARDLAKGVPGIVVLRAGGPALWRLELHGLRFSLSGDTDDTDLVHALLEPLVQRRVIYSCGVGAQNPSALPDMLLRLACGHRLDLRLHDFFLISPSWNLLDGRGRYCGVPGKTSTDSVHALPPSENTPGCSHYAWRENWAKVVAASTRITAFSPSSKAIFQEAYPSSVGKIVVRPHKLLNLPGPLSAGGSSLGILGGINLPKGGGVLLELSRTMSRRMVVIGELDGRYRLPKPHLVHGRYTQKDIGKLAKHYDIGAWLIPSVCPETFSFGTHEALATRLPVACFDLGAQAEAISRASNGHVLNCAPEETQKLKEEIELLFQ